MSRQHFGRSILYGRASTPRSGIVALALQSRVTISPFSTSFHLLRPSGTVDEELVAKLESEISLENQMEGNKEMAPALKDYLENGPWTLKDKPGHEEVELVRNFGEETIRVLFSIADLNSIDEKLEDSALYDRDENAELSDESESAVSKAAKRSTAAQTMSEEEDQEDEEYETASEPAFPVRLNITIEKPNGGALQVESLAQDGMLLVENVHYHKNAQIATAQTAEADYERRGYYVGPPFGNLDDDLQVLLERYLDDRGINANLAVFVPDYIDYKEQKEYLSWLENVKGFIRG